MGLLPLTRAINITQETVAGAGVMHSVQQRSRVAVNVEFMQIFSIVNLRKLLTVFFIDDSDIVRPTNLLKKSNQLMKMNPSPIDCIHHIS